MIFFRTLLNQLVSKICLISLVHAFLLQPLEVFLTIFGPFPPWFCYLLFYAKNVYGIMFIKLLFSLTLTKYLSIFVLKNPTGLNYDFWSKFIFSLIGLTSVVFQASSKFHFAYKLKTMKNLISYFNIKTTFNYTSTTVNLISK